MKPIARYCITSGLHGLYMPDCNSGPMEFTTRRELASAIRYELDFQEFPKALFRDANIRRLWGFIRRHGSSSAHFTIVYQGREIAFHGLTEEEFNQMSAEEC